MRRGFLLVALVVVGGVVGYRLAGYGWLEALWMVVITIFSVGYGERSGATPAVQLLTIGVVVLGISSAFYTFGGFLEIVLEGELKNVMGMRRRTKGIEQLRDHVVICGFGRIGQVLAEDLTRQRVPFVVIDQDAERTAEAGVRNYLYLEDDATSDEALVAAGIERAKTLVTCLPNDAANVFITLTGRNLNPQVQIIARAEHRSSERKLRQAGANRVVLPAANGARRMARLVTRPSTADVVELFTESDNLDYVLDELFVSPTCLLPGRTVAETQVNRKHRLLVVAVKESTGTMLFNPDGDYRFEPGQIVILMGRHEDIQNFRTEYRI